MEPISEVHVSQALARGYTYAMNSGKVLDPDLINAMTAEVLILLYGPQQGRG